MTVLVGDCRAVLRTMADNSIDAIVTDPPYELGFMGKKWDASGIAYSLDVWREALRVLKPGGYLLAFGGTRTYHRMTCAIEDSGFLIRDCLQWLYGSGFPKSLNVSKAIDAAAGATREVTGHWTMPGRGSRSAEQRYGLTNDSGVYTAPATDLAQQWVGWGTALKPANEPIVLAQKPLEGTYAANLAKWGVGALNIGGCRIDYTSEADKASATPQGKVTSKSGALAGGTQHEGARAEFERPELLGRWPANVLLDGAAAEGMGDVARYFYCAKASRKERDQGCEHLPAKTAGEATDREEGTAGLDNPRAGAGRTGGSKNYHPTVKPIQLMRYLCRLVTPPGGTVLDPFTGSGTTGVAALSEGFHFTGIELSEEYATIARARIAKARHATSTQFALFTPA